MYTVQCALYISAHITCVYSVICIPNVHITTYLHIFLNIFYLIGISNWKKLIFIIYSWLVFIISVVSNVCPYDTFIGEYTHGHLFDLRLELKQYKSPGPIFTGLVCDIDIYIKNNVAGMGLSIDCIMKVNTSPILISV